jgi:hypothetical protein
MPKDIDETQWYSELQKTLLKGIKDCYGDRWKYSEKSDHILAFEISNVASKIAAGKFDLKYCVYDNEEEELVIHATIGKDIELLGDVHELIHGILSATDENYFVFIPLHTKDMLQFWFITGYHSHCHKGRVIVNLLEHPHIQV